VGRQAGTNILEENNVSLFKVQLSQPDEVASHKEKGG
jgi:hypothetical protein